jgi:hypothetical protein
VCSLPAGKLQASRRGNSASRYLFLRFKHEIVHASGAFRRRATL